MKKKFIEIIYNLIFLYIFRISYKTKRNVKNLRGYCPLIVQVQVARFYLLSKEVQMCLSKCKGTTLKIHQTVFFVRDCHVGVSYSRFLKRQNLPLTDIIMSMTKKED